MRMRGPDQSPLTDSSRAIQNSHRPRSSLSNLDTSSSKLLTHAYSSCRSSPGQLAPLTEPSRLPRILASPSSCCSRLSELLLPGKPSVGLWPTLPLFAPHPLGRRFPKALLYVLCRTTASQRHFMRCRSLCSRPSEARYVALLTSCCHRT
jgi:hypothetical protein